MRGPPPVCHLKEWPLHGAPLDTSLSFRSLFHTRSLSLGLPKEGLSGPTYCSHLDTSSCHLSSQPLIRAPLPARGPSSVFFHRLVKKHHGPFLAPPPPQVQAPVCVHTGRTRARTHTLKHVTISPWLSVAFTIKPVLGKVGGGASQPPLQPHLLPF